MDGQNGDSPLTTLGQRLRRARRERGLSQEALAEPEFTKGYISALERGAVRPSLKALELLARRLERPIGEFIGAASAPVGEPDPDALAEDLNYELNYATMLIHTRQVEEARTCIADAERRAQPHLEQLPVGVRYRLPYLRGMAHLQLGEPVPAQAELEAALTLVVREQKAEETARVRNLLGVAHFQEGNPQFALAQHKQCLDAIVEGKARDPNLRLSVYQNLANDYWALDDTAQAIGIYREALRVLEDLNDLERQAGIYWGMSMAYRAEGQRDEAKEYAAKALHIYEATENRTAAASISLNLARIMNEQHEYAEAQRLLDYSRGFLVGTGDQLLLSTMYQNYAELALLRGELDQAAADAEQSVHLSRAMYEAMAAAPQQARANATRTFAQALHIAAQVEERRGHAEAADTLFQEALDRIGQTTFYETAYQINFSYAETLEARGSHTQAMNYYRSAALIHQHHRR